MLQDTLVWFLAYKYLNDIEYPRLPSHQTTQYVTHTCALQMQCHQFFLAESTAAIMHAFFFIYLLLSSFLLDAFHLNT